MRSLSNIFCTGFFTLRGMVYNRKSRFWCCSDLGYSRGKKAVSSVTKCKLFVILLSVVNTSMGQTERICGTQPTPSGWVTISYGGPCSTLGGVTQFYRTIRKIDDMPAGSTVSVCGVESSPEGWVTTDFDSRCATVGSITFYSRTIKKVDGMDQGSTVDMCSVESVPSGWILIRTGVKCSTVAGVTYFSRTIKKL